MFYILLASQNATHGMYLNSKYAETVEFHVQTVAVVVLTYFHIGLSYALAGIDSHRCLVFLRCCICDHLHLLNKKMHVLMLILCKHFAN